MKLSTAFTIAFATLTVAAPRISKRAGVLGTKPMIKSPSQAEQLETPNKKPSTSSPPSISPTLAAVDPADVDFLGAVNNIANDAETEAFNPAIEAATGDEKTALTNGKIKNKVLKLTATSLELQIKAA